MKKYILFAFITFTFGITGCNKDDAVYEKEILLIPGQTITKPADCGFQSRNILVAEVQTNGYINAHYIGTTRIYGGSSVYKVTVIPEKNIYFEPVLQKNDSQEYVKYYMKNLGYRRIDKENETNIAYIGKGIVDNYLFTFNNNKLEGYAVLTSDLYITRITEFLADCYIYSGKDGNNKLFTRADGTEVIILGVLSSNQLMVSYQYLKEKRNYDSASDNEFSFTIGYDYNDTRSIVHTIDDEYLNFFNKLKKLVE